VKIDLRIFLCAAVLGGVAGAQEPQNNANLPAQSIGRNDLIVVSVYAAPELSRTLRVGSDGMVRLPMLKQTVKAEGLHPAELEAAIGKALRDEEILNEPYLTVTIAEYHSRPISVVGAVKHPLVFQATTPVTLLEAIAKAEGLSEVAGQEILVSRSQPGPDGKPVTLTRRIPVRGLVDAADPELNLTLTGGEEVRVPETSKIYVVGNVRKPGSFPVQNGSETTVLQLLALSEGLMPFAGKEAYIYRREAGGAKNEIPIPLGKILERKSPDVALVADDILYVPDNKKRRMTIGAIQQIVGFGAATATGMLIWRR